MTHNINHKFEKATAISANSRDNDRFAAPKSEEANYFVQLANQHKTAKEQALDSYYGALNNLDSLTTQEESVLDSMSSQTKELKEKQEHLRQQAYEFKLKADNEGALETFNTTLAQTNQEQGNVVNAEPKVKGQEIDPLSQAAVDEFMAQVGAKKLTADEMSELYLRYSRQISINSPQAWAKLDNAYSNALGNAFTPDNTMDAQSKNAISNFRTAINPSMTRDEMMETYIRFSREVSIKFPEAWNELESILSNSLPSAYKPDTSMDAPSKSAIANFRSAINAGMTADEMNETFLRFSREVSIKFPAAWNQLESTLNNYLPNARKIDTSMDDQSRNAVANFKTALNTNMTKDEMTETFLRFTREVSINFPDAKKELESTLNQQVPNAFKHNTKSDPASEQAVSDFKTSIGQNHTKEDLIEMFLRFSRNISLKYPEKKNELISILNNSLPQAFTPDTTEKI